MWFVVNRYNITGRLVSSKVVGQNKLMNPTELRPCHVQGMERKSPTAAVGALSKLDN